MHVSRNSLFIRPALRWSKVLSVSYEEVFTLKLHRITDICFTGMTALVTFFVQLFEGS